MHYRVMVGPLMLLAAACGGRSGETSQDDPAPEPAAYAEEAAAEPAPTHIPAPARALASHNYDSKDGLVYSYIAAVSEEDRKKGKAAGDVVSFAYLGRRDGKYVLAQIGVNDSILGYSSCPRPCRVITYGDGSKVGYTEDSIIGSAFADAIAGRLVQAEEVAPEPPKPAPRPHTQPAAMEQDDGWEPVPQSSDRAEHLGDPPAPSN